MINNKRYLPALVIFTTISLSVASALAVPVVDAGKDTTIRLGTSFRFSPTVTADIAAVKQWAQSAGPSGGSVILVPDAIRSTVKFSSTGVYTFRLCITQDQISTCDSMKCTVLDSIPFKVLSPLAGSVIQTGSTITVSWQIFPAAPLTIELSTDNGLTYHYLVNSQVHDSSWIWSVASDIPPSTTCQLRLRKYFDFSFATISGTFSIENSSNAVRTPMTHTVGQKSDRVQQFYLDGRSAKTHKYHFVNQRIIKR